MDRLSRVTLLVALVFIGSCAGTQVGEGAWYLAGFASSGLALAILSQVRTIQLIRNWTTTSGYPLVISGLALLIAGFAPFNQMAEIFRSPRLLAGSCEHPLSYTHLVLRQDGTAEEISASFYNQTTRGTYSFHGDTVVLSLPKHPPALIRSSRLLLTKTELRELPNSDNTGGVMTFNLHINELSKK